MRTLEAALIATLAAILAWLAVMWSLILAGHWIEPDNIHNWVALLGIYAFGPLAAIFTAVIAYQQYKSESRRYLWRVAVYSLAGSAIVWYSLSWTVREEVVGMFHSMLLNVRGDVLQRTLEAMAPNAVDCGRVRLRAAPDNATDCAMRAFNSHRAFKVRYDLKGVDSDVAIGIVGKENGEVITLLFDGDPEGQGGTSLLRQHVSEKACPAPVRLFNSPNGRLSCFPPESKPGRNVMSPTFQPY